MRRGRGASGSRGAALLENFDESESDAGDTLQEWRERCLRAEDATPRCRNLRDKLEAQERITAEFHAKLADADQRYKAEISMREEAEAVVEELQTRPRTGTALDELAADLDEVQETLAEESERRQAAEAALAAKGGWSADLDRIRDAEAAQKRLARSWKMLGSKRPRCRPSSTRRRSSTLWRANCGPRPPSRLI